MDATTTAIPMTAPQDFEEFFEAERRRLLRALYLVTGNLGEAEEIAQDAFLALWERWDRVAGLDDPAGYLFRTALNRHRSRLRRAMRAARKVTGQAEGGDLFAAADERDALARALARLTTRRRAAIVLTEAMGYGSAEAGRLMGISDVTVRRLCQEARHALRTDLEANDDD